MTKNWKVPSCKSMLLPLLFQHAPLEAMGLLSYMNPHSTTQWKEAFRFLWCFLSETQKGTPLPAGFCGEGASSVVEMDWKHHMPVAEGRWHLCSGRSPGRGGEKSSSYQDKWAHLGKILFLWPILPLNWRDVCLFAKYFVISPSPKGITFPAAIHQANSTTTWTKQPSLT